MAKPEIPVTDSGLKQREQWLAMWYSFGVVVDPANVKRADESQNRFDQDERPPRPRGGLKIPIGRAAMQGAG